MNKQRTELILSNVKILSDAYRMTIESEFVAQKAVAGQFAHLKCGSGNYPMLRRPISICKTDPKAGTFDVIYHIKGEGTRLLSQMEAGQTIEVIAPLGWGFSPAKENEKICVIGGGIGIYPMYGLLLESKATDKIALLGFRSKDNAVMLQSFAAASRSVVCTDDGSLGVHGNTAMLLESLIEKEGVPDKVYACGPYPMLRAIWRICEAKNIFCEVSMEERMGCGIGACKACACKTKNLTSGEEDYSHVCVNGPVFDARKIVWR